MCSCIHSREAFTSPKLEPPRTLATSKLHQTNELWCYSKCRSLLHTDNCCLVNRAPVHRPWQNAGVNTNYTVIIAQHERVNRAEMLPKAAESIQAQLGRRRFQETHGRHRCKAPPIASKSARMDPSRCWSKAEALHLLRRWAHF